MIHHVPEFFTRARVDHRRFVGAGGFGPDDMQLVVDERSLLLLEQYADFLLQSLGRTS